MTTFRTMLAACFLFTLSGCAHLTEDFSWGEPCPTPSPGSASAGAGSLYFVTSRLPECRGAQMAFGRLRGEPASFGYLAAAQGNPVLVGETLWLERLRGQLANGDGRLLLFIHGYNTTFDQAAERAVEIARGSDFRGPLVLFSWPSQGRMSRYTWDEENALWTQAHFNALLKSLMREDAVRDLVLVAHSMGNRVALRALQELDTETDIGKIRTVFLAAPDVDRALFARDYLPVLSRAGRSTTIYASRVDRPLRGSWAVHGYPRTGDTGCRFVDTRRGMSRRRCVVRTDGIALVETSQVRGSALGHSDLVYSPAVQRDMCRLLRGEAPAERHPAVSSEGIPFSFLLAQPGARCPG